MGVANGGAVLTLQCDLWDLMPELVQAERLDAIRAARDVPLSNLQLVSALGRKPTSGHARDDVDEEVELALDRFQASARALYGDSAGAILTVHLLARAQLTPPSWLTGLMLEHAEALRAAFYNSDRHDQDSDYPAHDVYDGQDAESDD